MFRLPQKRWAARNELLVANCEQALSHRRMNKGTFRVAVENAIVPLLPHGKVRASGIATRLGLSQRTSARRLALEGVTFSEVLERLRGDLARRYLSDPDISISRIAWLLGYQEVSAFTHAFKRWTGKTPRDAHARQDVIVTRVPSLVSSGFIVVLFWYSILGWLIGRRRTSVVLEVGSYCE